MKTFLENQENENKYKNQRFEQSRQKASKMYAGIAQGWARQALDYSQRGINYVTLKLVTR
jgi:hypothetical protein